MNKPIAFEPMELVRGNVRVSLNYIGEGYGGDFNADDPDDDPLLRFSVERKDDTGEWRSVDNASYCTHLHARLTRPVLEFALTYIMGEIHDDAEAEKSIKRCCETLSWIDESCFGKYPPAQGGERELYVIYSPNESAIGSGAGFWNNQDGWTELDGATRFSLAERQSMNLPVSTGQDAAWVSLAEAEQHYGNAGATEESA